MCVYPTEHDSSVHVDLTHIAILLRGNDTAATATAWRILGAADSQPIPNVVFTWSSSNSSVATVDDAGHIVGITSGTGGDQGGRTKLRQGSTRGRGHHSRRGAARNRQRSS